MWEFEFEAPVGSRLHRYYRQPSVLDKLLWWSHEKKKFVEFEEIGNLGGSTHGPRIRTFKAFKRFLRKHPELRDCQVVLVSRYQENDIIARYVDA